MGTTLLVVVGGIGGASAAARAAVVNYDFNSAGQYAGSFQSNSGTILNSGNNFTQGTTGGIGGTGSLSATASDNNGTSVDVLDAINLASTPTVTLGGYFTPTTATANGSGPSSLFQLGLTATSSGSFGGVSSIDSLSGRVLSPAANGGAGNAISFVGSGGVLVTGTLTPAQVSLSAGSTYYLSVVLTAAGSNPTPGTSVAFTASETLYNANATTGALGSAIATLAASFTDASINAATGGQLYGDAAARFAFRGATVPSATNTQSELGTGSVDNLSITTVPEPTALAAVGVVAGSMLASRRRRAALG